MYIGSIKFFKHLIIGAILLLILGPTIALFKLGIENTELRHQLDVFHSGAVAGIGTDTDGSTEIDAAPGSDYSGSNTKHTIYAAELAYQDLYPELKTALPNEQRVENKTVYLTFDDGPSQRTLEILDILDRYHIKATFFVSGRKDEESKLILKEIADRGHTIGVHSYSHDYNLIYTSVVAFLDDFNKQYQLIYEATGVRPTVFRFPGGSINAYNQFLYQEIIAEMTRRGFLFYDWNASSGDTDRRATRISILQEALSHTDQNSRIILLSHDSQDRDATVKALPDIIDGYWKAGFRFDKITPEVKPIHFEYQ